MSRNGERENHQIGSRASGHFYRACFLYTAGCVLPSGSFNFPSNRRTIQHKLFLSVNFQGISHLLVIECPDCTRTTAYLLCGKVEILAGMSGIEVYEPVCPFAVSPSHPVDHC
jgi:hypothetical protein